MKAQRARTAWREAVEILESLDQLPPAHGVFDRHNKLPDLASLHAKLR